MSLCINIIINFLTNFLVISTPKYRHSLKVYHPAYSALCALYESLIKLACFLLSAYFMPLANRCAVGTILDL